MPLIGIKSKYSEFDAAVLTVDRVERAVFGGAKIARLFYAAEDIGFVYLDDAEVDDDLVELLRVYDAAKAKETK